MYVCYKIWGLAPVITVIRSVKVSTKSDLCHVKTADKSSRVLGIVELLMEGTIKQSEIAIL